MAAKVTDPVRLVASRTCSKETVHPHGYVVGCEYPLGHAGDHIAMQDHTDEYHWPNSAAAPVRP